MYQIVFIQLLVITTSWVVIIATQYVLYSWFAVTIEISNYKLLSVLLNLYCFMMLAHMNIFVLQVFTSTAKAFRFVIEQNWSLKHAHKISYVYLDLTRFSTDLPVFSLSFWVLFMMHKSLLHLNLWMWQNSSGAFTTHSWSPADFCLTGLQISTNQRATRKHLRGSIHSRAFRVTKYTCRVTFGGVYCV